MWGLAATAAVTATTVSAVKSASGKRDCAGLDPANRKAVQAPQAFKNAVMKGMPQPKGGKCIYGYSVAKSGPYKGSCVIDLD